MSINPFDRLRPTTNVADLEPPWPADAASVYARVLAASARTPVGAEVELSIHDDQTLDDDGEHTLCWAAGARDALLAAPDPSDISARQLISALGALVRRPSPSALAHLYALAGQGAASVVDEALEQLPRAGLAPAGVAAVARRLAREAPDVEPVKLGMALLGATGESSDVDLLLELGRYEELTLFSAASLRNLLEPEDAEAPLRRLGDSVQGWGRVHVVRFLSDAVQPETRDWLLREGYRNTVMHEETAWLCASVGGLVEALRAPEIDEALLEAAGDLIAALIEGGPAEDIDDYADGAEACRLFVDHLTAHPVRTAKPLFQVAGLREWLSRGDADWPARKRFGWTAEARWNLRQAVTAYLDRPEWRSVIEAGLEAEGFTEFWYAAHAATALGIDAWPYRLRRQRQGIGDDWWGLMQTDDPERVDQVLALARETLDLTLVGSGPTRSLGFGPDYAADSACDFIVQDLRRFPGLGVDFIELALRGRSIRLRNMGLAALEEWGHEHWPPGAEAWLHAAEEREPDPRVATNIANLLAGRTME